ncbi:response regulator receiver modulated diguanylate phosphodiesterase [Rhodopseudomonas palustris HaA2]|uniref:Response regulator receiver modulated diguanylate phosphodiesterase n=1 Tax=Rhodopseudomonas palustris (strain HaA2) TaxID=316058 RepID=Q2ITB4_RHOP2|nr:EAL domain-containing response regulator [Rhodopseudomonas palustris]ABD08546.1 response regulator receiver modulated diguanylate phosphodiesterase [Rhodopseudomonas palustris HaA2]
MPDSTDQAQAARILVVDDDPVQGAIISGVCRRRGYRPTFASSYQAAVDQIAAGDFECITIDLSLGDRDGIELLRLIAGGGRSPRVIVISGCDQRILSATVRMAHAVGVVDAVSLQKPIDLASLGDALSFGAGEQPSLRHRPDRQSRPVTAADLSRGLETGELYPAFQPKVNLATGRVVGCEALARWDSPTFGSVGPDVFIPLAEQSGLIKPLTLLMLRQSIELARYFFDIDPSFSVAVNLSAALLSDTTIPEEVERLLDGTGLPARSLIIEVTESTAMTDIACAMDIMLRLRIKGVGISIDDFGTGYSSLAVLARMPFSELKIDRSFVRDCLTDADMWKVVSVSVAIAHQYNMQAVAEGIEDAETWRALDGLGCDIGQGFGFSRALRRGAFVEWCRHWDERLTSVGPAAERHRACAT